MDLSRERTYYSQLERKYSNARNDFYECRSILKKSSLVLGRQFKGFCALGNGHRAASATGFEVECILTLYF